jgi:hypothetical protein
LRILPDREIIKPGIKSPVKFILLKFNEYDLYRDQKFSI